MQNDLSALIVAKLQGNLSSLRAAFAQPAGTHTRYAVMDEVLPTDLARRIHEAFPPVREMRLMSSFRERKHTSKDLDTMHSLIAAATFAFQSPEVIAAVAEITGFR